VSGKINSPWLRALLHPLNLAMLGLGVAAAMCAAWWLLPVSFVLYGLMVLSVVRDPSIQFQHKVFSRRPLARRFVKPFERIERVQVRLFNTLSNSGRDVQRALREVQQAVDDLVEQSYGVCLRMSGLENHRLMVEHNIDFEFELSEIERKIQGEEDALVRQDYEEVKTTLERRAGDLRSLIHLLDRVEAQLAVISNTIASVYTEILRLEALGVEEIQAESPELVAQIRKETQELLSFEREASRKDFEQRLPAAGD
jgi:hypothetical protein